MDSWSTHTPVTVKFEDSPAESLLSTPDEMYPSLFGTDSATTTMNTLEIMTPRSSFTDGEHPDFLSLSGETPRHETPETPNGNAQEKKPVKKRKSWGQPLPEPKTNLPPRKRAKTEDEKEQRRVERVLRNRRAAQTSRERKRQEVEGLEQRNKQLEALLHQSQQTNEALLNELQKLRREGGIVGRSSAYETLGQSPITLSQPLFGSQIGQTVQPADPLNQFLSTIPSNTNNTVNPASLSPTLTPVPEEEGEEESTAAVTLADATVTKMANASPDATQHSAVMLCPDLQCPSAEAPPSKWLLAPQHQLHPALALLQVFLTSTSAMMSICQRPLTQIAFSMKKGFSLPPTPSILNTIIKLVTTPHPSRSPHQTTSSTSTTSSPTSSSRSTNPTAARQQSRPSSTLRLKTLRKILTCSPKLARPLMDATLVALRLASSEGYTVDQVSRSDATLAAAPVNGAMQPKQHRPSKEVLLTLLWVLKVEERRLEIRQKLSEPGCAGVPQTHTPTTLNNKPNYILKVSNKKRSLQQNAQLSNFSLKRNRFA